MRLRSFLPVSALLATFVLPADSLHAAPPSHLIAAAATPSTVWVDHELVPGERLAEIADRYAVSPASILRWNKLDPNRPQFWVGEKLRIQTQLPDRGRHRIEYIARENDTWEKVAQRFSVDAEQLHTYWNPHEGVLQAGHQLTVWVEPGSVEKEPENVPLFETREVPAGAQSCGYPDSGRLLHAVQIPENPSLYTIRNMEHAYGSTHAIGVLQHSIATFRSRTGFDREVAIWDMSTKKGGRYGPHHSHRSGRDVDISLLLRAGYVPGSMDRHAVDWEATWQLIRAFIDTGEVRYVFLSRPQQFGLYKAAKACGATPDELDRMIQFPRTEKVAIVRHAPGHTGHIHVRFLCGTDEPACRE